MLAVLPARCRSHSRLEQPPEAPQAPPLHMGSPQSSALCSPHPCIPSFVSQPSFALVHSECEAPLVSPMAPIGTTTPGHQHFIPPPLFPCLPFGAPGEKGLGRVTSTAPGTPAPHAKRLHPLVPRPPVYTRTALVQGDLPQAGVNCTLPAAGRAVGLEKGESGHSPIPSFQQPGFTLVPPRHGSALWEWEGKVEPRSLFSSKGRLRLGEAHCRSGCFALL